MDTLPVSISGDRAENSLARADSACSNGDLAIDRHAVRRFMVQWIAARAVSLYRSKHGRQG